MPRTVPSYWIYILQDGQPPWVNTFDTYATLVRINWPASEQANRTLTQIINTSCISVRPELVLLRPIQPRTIAGIVIGGILGLALIVALAYFGFHYRLGCEYQVFSDDQQTDWHKPKLEANGRALRGPSELEKLVRPEVHELDAVKERCEKSGSGVDTIPARRGRLRD